MNEEMLTDVNPCAKDEDMLVYTTNGGYQEYNQMGMIKFFPFEVFYNPDSIANR